jgi:hypothetical protein
MGGVDVVSALAVQADGKMVAAGQSNADVAVARYGTTATPSTVTTTTAPTTAPANPVCAIFDRVAAVFASNPFLQPFVWLVDLLRRLFGCT